MSTKTKKVSQKGRILAYLNSGHKVNTILAVNRFGAYRLSAVMFSLKEDGYKIKSEKVTLRNPKGGVSHVSSYRLAA